MAFAKIEGDIRGNVAMVTFEFASPILQAIKKPDMYVKLNLFIQRGLNSKYSLALYEGLKDYLNLGSLRMGITDFRSLLGVQPQHYKYFTMLKTRVLDVAVNEINEKTNLQL